jgi:hypothetical protein
MEVISFLNAGSRGLDGLPRIPGYSDLRESEYVDTTMAGFFDQGDGFVNAALEV